MAGDRIEQLGVERSYGAIADADAILLVVDASQPVSAEDWNLSERLAGLSYVVVYNKSDLPRHGLLMRKPLMPPVARMSRSRPGRA